MKRWLPSPPSSLSSPVWRGKDCRDGRICIDFVISWLWEKIIKLFDRFSPTSPRAAEVGKEIVSIWIQIPWLDVCVRVRIVHWVRVGGHHETLSVCILRVPHRSLHHVCGFDEVPDERTAFEERSMCWYYLESYELAIISVKPEVTLLTMSVKIDR